MRNSFPIAALKDALFPGRHLFLKPAHCFADARTLCALLRSTRCVVAPALALLPPPPPACACAARGRSPTAKRKHPHARLAKGPCARHALLCGRFHFHRPARPPAGLRLRSLDAPLVASASPPRRRWSRSHSPDTCCRLRRGAAGVLLQCVLTA